MYERILVCTDGSTLSKKAVRAAIGLAAATDAELVALHVVPRYPLGFFEGSQAASGSATLIGDLEYRGQNLNKSSGTYFGFVDSGTAAASNTTDVTVAAPYAWRP